MKKSATFLFIILNGTWALTAFLLHMAGLRSTVIATVVAIGALFGNLAVYAGIKFGQKLLSKRGQNSN